MSFFWMRMFVCWEVIIFIIRMSALMLSYAFFLLCSTCNIFIMSWILKFCMLISVTIIFWSDWLITFLITCLIIIMKWVLITQVFDSRIVAQSVFFIIWVFVSAEFSVSTMSSLESFLAAIIFFLSLFSIFVFTVFTIFVSLISSLLRDEHSCCRIMILCLIHLNTALIIRFDFIFSIST